jgi:hypothetical protein
MITLGNSRAENHVWTLRQIHTKFEKSSWNALSRFNAAGLITFDCQDARDRSQRTYIDGFMTKDDALKLSDSFNTSSNHVSIVVPTVNSWHRCSRIAMCTERAIIENQIPYACRQRCVLHFAYQVGLSPEVLESENIVIFRCFDPVWGRGATVEQGLYTTVFTILWNWLVFFEVLKWNEGTGSLSPLGKFTFESL